MAVKTLLFYSTCAAGKPYGWSEGHYWLDSSDLDEASLDIPTLVSTRSALMGDGVVFTGARISVEGSPREARFLPSSELIGSAGVEGSGKVGNKHGDADQPNACLVLRATNNDEAHKSIFLNGLPDALLRTNPVGPDYGAVAGWKDDFEAYKKSLVDGPWGFKARVKSPASTQVIDYTEESTGTGKIGVVVKGDIAAIGDRVQIRKATQKNRAFQTINGMWRVSKRIQDTEDGTFTYFLRGTEAIPAGSIDEPGTLELVGYTYYAYT